MNQTKGQRFRELLHGQEMIFRPCAYDALSAILIERAGFEIIGTTGYGISASLIGQPDMGLVDFSKMLERSRTIINAVSAPVDVDIDTGYGNALNTYWATKNFAMIGAAGVRIEDQVWPKRCGHMAGKQVISKVEMVGKIEAAIKARDEEGTGMVIGARTDARTVTDLEDTIERAKTYAEAGADYVYVEAPQSLEEVERLVEEIPTPVAFNIIPGGKTPPFQVKELEVKGVSYISVPMICLYTATKAITEALETLKETRDVVGLAEKGVSWSEFNEIVGLSLWRRLELEACPAEELIERYGTDDLERIIEEELVGTEEVWKNRGLGL